MCVPLVYLLLLRLYVQRSVVAVISYILLISIFLCVCESLCLNQHLVSELDSVCNTCVLGKQGRQAFLTRKT